MTDDIFTIAFNVMGLIILFLYFYVTYSKKGWKRFERFSAYVHFLFPLIGIFVSIVIFAFLISLNLLAEVLFVLLELILTVGAYGLNTSSYSKMRRKFNPDSDYLLANFFPDCEPDCDDKVTLYKSKTKPSVMDPVLYFKEHYDILLEFDPNFPDKVTDRYYNKIHPELKDELNQPPKYELTEAESKPKKKAPKKSFKDQVTEALVSDFVNDQINTTPQESLKGAFDRVSKEIEQQEIEEDAQEARQREEEEAEREAREAEERKEELTYAEEKARFLDILKQIFEGFVIFIRYAFYFWTVEPWDMPSDRNGNKTELMSYVKYLILTLEQELPYVLVLDNRPLRSTIEQGIEFTRIFSLLGGPHSEYAIEKLKIVRNLQILDGIRNFEELEETQDDAAFYETKAYRLARKVKEMRLNSETLEQHIQSDSRRNKRSRWFRPEDEVHKKRHWYSRR